MRFVSQEINSCLDHDPGTRANFGLIFNKWLSYRQNKGKFEPEAFQNPGTLITKFKAVKTPAAEVLKQHHVRQAEYCRAMEKAGWTLFVLHAELTAPFVSGLGMTHPTETGLVLDHTSGMPYIPAAGQKGVLRLAHLVNSLRGENGDWLSENLLKEKGIIDDDMNWMEDDASRTLFGYGGDTKALAGQLTILDAYPLKPPELGEDILNPHYNDYYQGNRGPTEDQSPVLVKFLVVKPGLDFVFRVLLRMPFSDALAKDQDQLAGLIRHNLERALTEVGMGAKTSLGFGRFKILSSEEPADIADWKDELDEKLRPWNTFIRESRLINDWNQFKQKVLERIEGQEWEYAWQQRLDVAQAVKVAAEQIRVDKPDRWTEERDDKIAEWLQPAGVRWERQSAADTPVADNPLLEKIRSFKRPADYDRSLEIANLDIECCRALQPLFKQWKWDKKRKAKPNNHQLWKTLQERISRLK